MGVRKHFKCRVERKIVKWNENGVKRASAITAAIWLSEQFSQNPFVTDFDSFL